MHHMKPPVRKSKKLPMKCITPSEAFAISGNDILSKWIALESKPDGARIAHCCRVRTETIVEEGRMKWR